MQKLDTLDIAMSVFLTTMRKRANTYREVYVLFIIYVFVCGERRRESICTRREKRVGVGLGKTSDPQGKSDARVNIPIEVTVLLLMPSSVNHWLLLLPYSL